MKIREKDKQLLIALFSQIKEPMEVLAYGSRVNNTAHEGSDLDLVIRSKSSKSIKNEELQFLQEQIQNSNIPILVDLRSWEAIPLSFHLQIEKKSQLFYSNCK